MKNESIEHAESLESENNMSKEKEEVVEQEIPVSEETIEQESTDNQQEIALDFATMDEAIAAIADLQVQLREALAERDKHKDHALRLQADFVNFRKRKEKESADNIRFANQELLVNILPVLDDFDRTLDSIEKTDNLTAVKEGIALVDRSMKKTLGKIGLEVMESTGKEFDSELHEAITSIPVDEEEKKGKVMDTVKKGYKLKDRVIRFAKVVVGE